MYSDLIAKKYPTTKPAQIGHAHSGMSLCIAVPMKPATNTVQPDKNSISAAMRARKNALNAYKQAVIIKPAKSKIKLAVSIRILVEMVDY